jgi:hypothetical protein
MQKFGRLVLFLLCMAMLLGCEEDPKKKLRKERATQFLPIYLKKYSEDSIIVIPYENCVKGRDEAVDKCLLLATKDDMQRLIVNKYITEREEYLKNGKLEEFPENSPETSSKDTIKKQENHIILMKKFS